MRGMRERIRTIVGSSAWERVIVGVILLNAVTLGLETSDQVMAAQGGLVSAIDTACLSIFVVEILLRLYGHRLAFFRDPWSLFDFTIVAIALVPASGPFQVLRALRILRVLRLISVVPSLRRVVAGLINALPGMGSIILLLSIVFYVASVIATELFGDSFPALFGTLGRSAYSLFQVMTLESWSMSIVRPIMEVYPLAWVFFVPFILLTAFVVLNLFIGVIVSALQDTVDDNAVEYRNEMAQESAALTAAVRELQTEVRDLKHTLESRRDITETGAGN